MRYTGIMRNGRLQLSRRLLSLWMFAIGLSAAGLANAAEHQGLAERTGIIRELDFGANTMVVNGIRYQVAFDVRVEIGGSHGAFTMLRPEMQIRYEYLMEAPDLRRVVLIQQIPNHVDIGDV